MIYINNGRWGLLIFASVVFAITANSSIAMGQKEGKKIIQPNTLTGRWYSSNPETLTKEIEGYFKKAKVKPKDNVIALILPHAGYQYSGQTAAYGLKAIGGGKYKRIVVIGPSHYVNMRDELSVPDASHYITPLGEVPLDTEFIQQLLKTKMFKNRPDAHSYEHSVQIELPLLQYCQKDFKFVPIVAGACSPETIVKAADALKGLVDDQTLVIASSDFVHYGPNYGYMPFKENIPEQIKKLDMDAFGHIAKLDSKGFYEYKQTSGATICGSVPIAILLAMLEDGVNAELVKYTTSGELAGDFTNSVSYLSAVFCGSWKKNVTSKEQQAKKELTEADKKELLKLARQTMNYYLDNRRVPNVSELDVKVTKGMRDWGAAFVTLKKGDRLRGCIGEIFSRGSLYKSVIRHTINACVNDLRFPPLTKAECKDVTIEISALTGPVFVDSADDIRVGVDGVVLSKDDKQAVFLPQVATENGWDLAQMLTQLSLKAGLPADSWKKNAHFMVFQAQVFSEEG